MKKGIMALSLAAFFLCLAACQGKAKQAGKGQEAIRPKVRVETINPSDIKETASFTGILSGWQEAALAPSMPGRVRKIYVKEGDRVKTDALLADMDMTQLEASQSQYDVSSSNYNRMKTLYEAGAVPRSQFEQVEMAYKQAQLGLNSTKENTQIRAPFSGVITGIAVEEGEIYSSMSGGAGGFGGLIRVSDLTRMKMDIMASEKAVVRLSKGQKVELSVDVYPDTVFSGRIHWINPAADPGTRTFQVRVEINNPGSLLKAGFYGRTLVNLREKKAVLAVPEAAVIDGRYLYVAEGGKAFRRDVQAGIASGGRVEVVSGIKAGESVVISGNRGLTDGIEVEIAQ